MGNLLIADTGNHRIREVTPDGFIKTVAGNGNAGFSGDGWPATQAQLNDPFDGAIDPSGNLYIADNYNHRVRKVIPDGTISTVGNGIGQPNAVVTDAFGNVFVSDE